MSYSVNPIEIWDNHEHVNLNSSNISVTISCLKPKLPEEIERRVEENWQFFKRKYSRAKDNQISYIISYQNHDGQIKAEVFLAGFKYNQYLNRDDKEMLDSSVANSLNYNPFASWIIPVCEKGKRVLFGNKIDFGNRKVSGFGGFTIQGDIVGNQIDVNRFVQRILEGEMGEMCSRIQEKYILGLNFFPIVGPKGFDGVYLVELDGKAEDLQKYFAGNEQFSKQLISVGSDPRSLIEFLENSSWEPTTSCVGGIFNYIGSKYGEDELRRSLARYSRGNLVQVLTSYFNGKISERLSER